MSDGSCSLIHLKVHNKEQNRHVLLPTYIHTSAVDEKWMQENKPLILQNIVDTMMEHLDYVEKNVESRYYSTHLQPRALNH